ncbi:MAG: hypothetical protein ACAI43_27030 [Phycisphaerae bacterium]|nr:hypothetical protein [Tepidisphaeraceae bacterium]
MNRPARTLPHLRRLVAAAAIGLAGTLAVAPDAQAAPPAPAAVWVKFDQLPRRVRDTIDRERGTHDLRQILRVSSGGRPFYRVIIDDRGREDRVVFVSELGTIMKRTEVPDLNFGHGDNERWVFYRDLPREVRDALDRARGGREVKQVWFVRRDNREFYRCIVEQRGDDVAFRIGPSGKLLSIDEVEDVAVGAAEARRFEIERERWVKIEDVPRPVRKAIDDEFGRREVRRVIFVERGGRQFYRVVTDDKVVRVSEDGYVYRDREIADVAYGPETWESPYGREVWVKYATVPRDVKETLDRERKGREVKQIFHVERGRFDYYRAIIDTRGDDTAVRIAANGKLLAREDVEDTAIGGDEIRDHGAREEWVKYATLPRPARDALDRERGREEVLKIVRVDTGGGRSYYRCTIDSRPYPTVVRISEDGRTMRER